MNVRIREDAMASADMKRLIRIVLNLRSVGVTELSKILGKPAGEVSEMLRLDHELTVRDGAAILRALGSGPQNPPNTPNTCLLYTSPSPRDRTRSRMPSSA